MRSALPLLACAAALASPLTAKESLGVFSSWGAFRDPEAPRCYAIAMARPDSESDELQPFATIGTWPTRDIRGQVHFRLSRQLAERPSISLTVGGKRFRLTGGGADAWARDRTMDAAIVAAMRSAGSMSVRATDRRGRRFSDSYPLAGAATAMDAATVACAQGG